MERGKIKIWEHPDGDSRLAIKCPPHVAIRLRRLFGGVQRLRAGEFMLSATPAAAYDLEWFRQRHPLDVEKKSESKFRELVKAEEKRLASIAEVDLRGYVPRKFKLALPPRKYQRVAADLALRTGQLLIADDLGLGKTVSAICTFTAPGKLPAIVVTMTHLPRQWERELGRFAPKLRVHRIRSGKPYSLLDVKFEPGPDGKRVERGVPDVIIVNYHKLNGWVENLAAIARTIVFDEVQELRHDGSLKYGAAKALADTCELKIGLSATPIYNYGAEIYSVVHALAPTALGTRKEFYDEWCGGANEGSIQDRNKICVADPAALGTYLRESGIMIRRTRKEVGRELPALTIVRHAVEVDPDRIDEAVADVAELAKRVLERTGSNFELMKWSGEIDYRMRQATGIGKAAAVSDFVRLLVEAGERVVLYGWHHEVYSLWRASFSRENYEIPFSMYTGAESESAKVQSVKDFVEGRSKVLIISHRAGAGLDGLQHVSRTVVIGELDWSPQVHAQNIGRVHRDGQKEPVAAYYLVAEEGSDPVIADVLGLKDAQSTGIMNPELVGSPQLVGAANDHIKRLAEDVLRRRSSASSALLKESA
ncbi:MAG: putative helicase [Myxococcales bacterium]|nr:putative helicase [Myxococcales bacterium]